MGRVRRAKIELMYREYIRVSGLNREDIMSPEEQVERKRAFMSGIWFLGQYINDNFTRYNSNKFGNMLLDVDKQLRRYWDSERKREEEMFEDNWGKNNIRIDTEEFDNTGEDFQNDNAIE